MASQPKLNKPIDKKAKKTAKAAAPKSAPAKTSGKTSAKAVTKTASAKAPKRAGHDVGAPQAFIDSMMRGWKVRGPVRASKLPGLERFQARRAALSRLFPGEIVVVPTGTPRVRANDCDYIFRPGSDFFYLTGNQEPGCVLALIPKKRGKAHDAILFVEPEVDRSTPAFFLDRARGALWVGPKLGLVGSLTRYGVTATRSIDELADFLKSLDRKSTRLLRGLDPRCDAALKPAPQDAALATALAEMRLIKDAGEIASLKKAIQSTKHALEAAIQAMGVADNERHIEAAFDAAARVQGNGSGFATIAAAGPHACTLHWTQNDGPLKRGDLLLIDAGVEGKDLYSADISRTFPICGLFTDEQRCVYDLVTKAQDAAIKAVAPGADFLAPHRAAMAVLTKGLIELGIIEESLETALDDEHQTYRRYTLHSTSHLLGLDVHDSASARPESYRQGKLKPGMVLTIEPGLYFQPDDLTVPPRFRGIGIRVEEDVLVTATGRQVLSAAIPRKSADIEKWIAELWNPQGLFLGDGSDDDEDDGGDFVEFGEGEEEE
ncbi:MAG: aminopeptidase P family protein [Myxococcales bacterium]|jgi:Xaa-Pro aminopeptidase|nr:aminopeptidase P family protein [Myxococcales bacterium]